MPTDEIINIEAEDANGRPVTINCESGSTVTINVNIRNYYGAWPEWLDRGALDALMKMIQQVKGGGNE